MTKVLEAIFNVMNQEFDLKKLFNKLLKNYYDFREENLKHNSQYFPICNRVISDRRKKRCREYARAIQTIDTRGINSVNQDVLESIATDPVATTQNHVDSIASYSQLSCNTNYYTDPTYINLPGNIHNQFNSYDSNSITSPSYSTLPGNIHNNDK